MIKDLELHDFISHKDTRLEFGKGITIFVGHNGAGKSSVIDAITFALFGEHTRRHNKNLVRRGSGTGQAMVKLRFTLNSREFQATRSLTTTGTASFSQLELVSEHGKTVNKKLAGGERKQYGESMSVEVAKILGLDYKKLQVAAVVQQGELVRIIEAQPKEFKELLNGLIGIDRLDVAFATMKDVVAGFRGRLRDEVGYTDEDLPRIRALIVENEKKLKEAERLAGEYAEEKLRLDEKMVELDRQISAMEPLREKDGEIKAKEKRLIRYVADRRDQVANEVSKLERAVREAKSALELLKGKEETCMRLEMVKAEVEEIHKHLEAIESSTGKLQGLLECAGKLQIVDGKCPVCNSAVQKVNEMFDSGHIKKESVRLVAEKSRLQIEKIALKKEEQKLVDEGKRIAAAEAFLAINCIKTVEDVAKLEVDLAPKRAAISRLPIEVVKVGDDPFILAIDDASRSYAEEVASLRLQVKSFSMAKYMAAKDEKWKVLQKLQDAATWLGAYQKTAQDAKAAIACDSEAVRRLEQASEVLSMLERIRSVVFNRDGAVGMSLRSWALGMISRKASDYASLFNIGISRIELAEKAREIAITCYGKNGEINMDSLSGGEKVAVALALRLGIAHMMGSGKLDYVILDEPTTHLDEERRKALVRIISEAFREGSGPLSQMLIITHDSEIFEDSEVDAVFRFAMTAEGSHVARE
ncbi:MAG: AAA family ATPase [Nitrososphaera sp.]|uniref:AAA family ATPase n=1 Tax=Nitrososphaera sp. TaxID=1971748 RepID=UPI003D6ED248